MDISIFDSDDDQDDFEGFTASDLDSSRNNNAESDISVDESSSSEDENLSEEESEEQEIVWSTNNSDVNFEPFNQEVGPKTLLSEEKNALDFLLLLFPETLIAHIVTETNRYAKQCIAKKPDRHWFDTTVEEMKAFLGLNILFGIKSLPEIKLYWSKDPLLGVIEFQKVMSRNRFDKIRQYLHLNVNEQNNGQDKLFKVRPLLDVLSQTFKEEYSPSQNASIDEGMIKYKGRLGFKQYMPNKPVKRRIKVWMRADASNGYVSEFSVYTRPGCSKLD